MKATFITKPLPRNFKRRSLDVTQGDAFFLLFQTKKHFIYFFIVTERQIAYNGTNWTQLLGAEKRFLYEQKNSNRFIRWTVIGA